MGRSSELKWDFACPDWFERLCDGRSLIPDLPLNEDEAQRAVDIFDMLHLPDIIGTPPLAEMAGEWQREIIRAIFGSMVNGERRVPECFLMVPKKNGKTTSGAAIVLTSFLLNQRPRSESIYVGPTKEVADVAFQQTCGMIEADPEGYLPKRFNISEHTKTITDRWTKSKLRVKTFDMKVVTGSKPVFVLLDELHLMSKTSNAANIIGQIRGGLLPNPEGHLLIITTQSDEPPAGVFKSELDYARRIRDGKAKNARMLPVLYEFPDEMQRGASDLPKDAQKPWQRFENWKIVTPNLNRSITLPRLIADYHVAVEKGEEELRRWASQHLNIEIGVALSMDGWIGAKYWDGAVDPEPITFEALMDRSEVVTVGGDGGGLDDLYGMAAIGRDRETKDWLLWAHAWAHDDVMNTRKEIASRLRDFERDGDLTVCSDPTQPHRDFAEYCAKLRDADLLPERYGVGLDPVGVADTVDELALREMTQDDVVCAVPQGFALSGAVWGMESRLKNGTLWHGGTGLMAWCVGNAKGEQRGNAVHITKAAAGKAKIDPLIASFNAFKLMARGPQAATAVEYERGTLFV